MAFVRAAKVGAVPPGAVAEFDVDGKAIALANVAGKLYAINGVCVHEGGPLGEGALNGNLVICPWHAWEYDVTTGKIAGSADGAEGVACYPVEVRGEDIFVDVG
ncbi:MAG TPA: Rieske 2Fe-2S domain-containing protein [Candidatus Dormibacteraeota bacterium]|nr:Rieske 2Fe-2S domain-containing protein [Candidatus Dormibacteraeota bacterium]